MKPSKKYGKYLNGRFEKRYKQPINILKMLNSIINQRFLLTEA